MKKLSISLLGLGLVAGLAFAQSGGTMSGGNMSGGMASGGTVLDGTTTSGGSVGGMEISGSGAPGMPVQAPVNALTQSGGMMSGGMMSGGSMSGGSGGMLGSTMSSASGGMSGGAMSGGSMSGGSQGGQSIAALVSGNSQFSTLLTALNAAGLTEEFTTGGPYTVFAPTNAAFNKLPSSELNAILGNLSELTNLLQNHVISGTYNQPELGKLPAALMLNGKELPLSTSGGNLTIGGVTVTSTPIQASNGVIYPIDTVLLPAGLGAQSGGTSSGGQ